MLFKNHLVFRIMQKIKILLFFYGTFSVMELFKIELIYVRNDNVIKVAVHVIDNTGILVTADSKFLFRIVFMHCLSDFLSCFVDLFLNLIHFGLI